jgi:Rieske Fe-S protein
MSKDSLPPTWRRDFPYSALGEEETTRREFTRYLVLASAAFAGGSGLVSIWASLRSVNTGLPTAIVALDEVAVGTSYTFEYPTPQDPAILVRPDEGTVLAFSQKCTHLGCVVFWSMAEQHFECPCHEGMFNLDGRPVAGPPDRPLTRIDLELRDGIVWASGVANEGEA